MRNSLRILNELREYDSFLDGLTKIVDMGCGTGEDIEWWSTLETRDDPPVPYNYTCYAVDINAGMLNRVPNRPNIIKIQADFEKPCIPVPIDFIFAHNVLQYATDPLNTLKVWNQQMHVNGMLCIAVPQHSGVIQNRYHSRSYNNCYFNYTPLSLIYMLAVNGFDCNDAYLLKQLDDPWILMAVYKSNIAPMDPKKTNWATLAEKGLLNPSIVASMERNGHIRQEEVVYPWLDRENYFIEYVSQATEIPAGISDTKIEGVFNQTIESEKQTLRQSGFKEIKTKIEKPIGVLRPPKIPYVK